MSFNEQFKESAAWLQKPTADFVPLIKTLEVSDRFEPDEFEITGGDEGFTVVGGKSGCMYGRFALARALAAAGGTLPKTFAMRSKPAVKHRILNHWDNIDGTVERGYAGRSIFFSDGYFAYDAAKIRQYAQLLASVGINEICVNNVNVTFYSARLITDFLLDLAKLADIFREYYIRVAVAVHFETPLLLGYLDTCDPLDEQVKDWWTAQANSIYRLIPDFAGFLVKADSEFRGGPESLGRTQADGANMLARALKPHGGVVYWRCFIYNCKQDWRDKTIDRPKHPYDLFKPQDGLFDDNVILQVKNGPSDFQVREPNSPLIGAMEHTRECLEVQITQEYTGQQTDVYNLATQWEETLDFPIDGGVTRDLFGDKITAMAGVCNVGKDENLTGHTLAQLNLYAFGRLAWDPSLTARQITDEWAKMTFGDDEAVIAAVTDIMEHSRGAYEKYTSPLGIGWFVNINHHYGPSPDGYEYMKWGTYHRANRDAVGVDRTASGTGFTAQYAPSVRAVFEDPHTCPQEMLLYFHRLPYDFRLKSGKTLVQHIYDTHFEGVEDVERFIALWDGIKEKLAPSVFASVAEKLKLQLENAREWRDVVNSFFYRFSGVKDDKGREIY